MEVRFDFLNPLEKGFTVSCRRKTMLKRVKRRLRMSGRDQNASTPTVHRGRGFRVRNVIEAVEVGCSKKPTSLLHGEVHGPDFQRTGLPDATIRGPSV